MGGWSILPCGGGGQTEKITALAVTGGHARRIHGTWFTSVDLAQNVTVTAATQPNDGATWANLVWQNAAPNGVQAVDIPRTPAGPLTVSASLDNTKSVDIRFVRLATLESENGVATPDPTIWKHYIGQPDAKILATPDFNRSRYTNEFLWNWNTGNAGSSASRRLVPLGPVAADIPVTPTLFEDSHLTITLHVCAVPALQVDRLQFAGGRAIDCDTLGNFDQVWEATRADPVPPVVAGPQPNSPLCYTRNTVVQITARFAVATAPTDDGEIVRVRGTATIGGKTLRWEDNNVVVNQADATVTTAAMNSSAPLPNKVAFYSHVDIHWETIGPDGVTRDAGHTFHDIYTALANSGGGADYWTLLHNSCVASHGATGESAVISRTFAAFALAPGVIRRRDGTQMTYWVPNNTDAQTTFDILQRVDGGGQCGAWAHLFVDMLLVHGITRIRFRQVEHANGQPWGFLVRNWTFQHPPASSRTAFTHQLNVDCVTRPPFGLPGQANANPPPAFYNHFVAEDTVNGKVYDPSYAAGPYGGFRQWEAAAIAGLFRNAAPQQAGYDKSLFGASFTRLLIDN